MFLYTDYPAFSSMVLMYPNPESVKEEVDTASDDAPEQLGQVESAGTVKPQARSPHVFA